MVTKVGVKPTDNVLEIRPEMGNLTVQQLHRAVRAARRGRGGETVNLF
jgi:16S rRNA A1518/A1519 N6-dimethyltransferase RsmA/KsgA/DIM1 with predicted DNA glycosylase/AP lyase activity